MHADTPTGRASGDDNGSNDGLPGALETPMEDETSERHLIVERVLPFGFVAGNQLDTSHSMAVDNGADSDDEMPVRMDMAAGEPSESQLLIEQQELDTARERSLHDAAQHDGQAGDEAASQLIERLDAVDREAAAHKEAAAMAHHERDKARARLAQADAAARAKRSVRFGSDGFGGTVEDDASGAAAARRARRLAFARTHHERPPVPRRDFERAEARLAAGEPAPLDEVTLSHALSRGISSEAAQPEGSAEGRTAHHEEPARDQARCATPHADATGASRGLTLAQAEIRFSHTAEPGEPPPAGPEHRDSQRRPPPVGREMSPHSVHGSKARPEGADAERLSTSHEPEREHARCVSAHESAPRAKRGDTLAMEETHISASPPPSLRRASQPSQAGTDTSQEPQEMEEEGHTATTRPNEARAQGSVAHGGDSDGSRASATRPPAALGPKALAAAVRIGLGSAGLAWIEQAEAATAAYSTAPPRAQQPEREQHGRADADVPLIGEPPRHEREVTLPVPDDFVWPKFAFICFYEHSGEEREAYHRALDGAPTCSVADRRSILPPSPGTLHVIGTVQAFLEAYPHSIPLQSNHVTCGWSNWASWPTWPEKILDGSMRRSAEEFLRINSIGDRSVGEQPPTAHQHTVGPPTFVVNGHDFAAPNKHLCGGDRATSRIVARRSWLSAAVLD